MKSSSSPSPDLAALDRDGDGEGPWPSSWRGTRAASSMAALAHPVRLMILEELARRDACCVKDVVRRVGLAQSTVSQHIKVLVNAGIVSYRPERQSSFYSLDRAAMRALAGEIGAFLAVCCTERPSEAAVSACEPSTDDAASPARSDDPNNKKST